MVLAFSGRCSVLSMVLLWLTFIPPSLKWVNLVYTRRVVAYVPSSISRESLLRYNFCSQIQHRRKPNPDQQLPSQLEASVRVRNGYRLHIDAYKVCIGRAARKSGVRWWDEYRSA